MKKFFCKFNTTQKTIFLEIIIGLIFVLFSIFGIVNKQYGWTIGIVAGTFASVICTLLMIKSSSWALGESKTGLFLLAFFGRMILLGGFLVLAAVLQYVLKYDVFNYSIWGVLIGYTPMAFVTIFVQVKCNKNGEDK